MPILLRLLPWLGRAGAVLALVAGLGGGLWGIYALIRADGVREGRAAAEAECTAERLRLERANQAAIDAANRRLVELADQLRLRELQLDDYVKAIDLASAADPGGAAVCLDALGVRRLNTIR